MRKRFAKPALATVAAALVGACLIAGCSSGSGAASQGETPQSATAQESPASAAAGDGKSLAEWKALYPAQYYSFAAGADDMDDMGGFITKTGNAHSHASLRTNMGDFERSTCISCKSATFNDWLEEYGDDVFVNRYNKDVDNRYIEALEPEDVWSCRTCHSDISDPVGSLGAQIVTFTDMFGRELNEAVDPGDAVCGQCHNGLSPWHYPRILDGANPENTSISAYRYGFDPDALIKATLEDATETADSPSGKTYATTAGSHAQVDEALGIYRIDNGSHFEVEIFQGSVMEQAGVTCVDCHMAEVTTVAGETFTSHDASGSPLDSYNALTYCLTCHKNQGIETPEDMVQMVRDAQADLAALDAELCDKQDECFEVLKNAIVNETKSEEVLDQARYNYAVAIFYKEYVFGGAEKAGEKVAHNPEMCTEYLERAIALLDDTMTMLA